MKWASFRESDALLPFQAIYTDFTYDCVCCACVCVSIVVLSSAISCILDPVYLLPLRRHVCANL